MKLFKHINAGKIKSLWDKYGFFAVMGLCVATIGVTAALTRKAPAPLPTLPPAPTAQISRNVISDSGEKLAQAQTRPPAPTQPAAYVPKLVWPVQGEIVQGYSGDTPVYNQTLGHFSVHAAIDIPAPEGQTVAACMDGTITGIKEDFLMGNTIEITHENGYVSKYMSLGTLALVSVGDPVRAGQTISYAGENINEAHLGAHIHFELIKDGEPVDPVPFLP